MRCPDCHQKGRLTTRHYRIFDDGVVGRVYRCSNPDCDLRYTTLERIEAFPRTPRIKGTKLYADDVAIIKAVLATKVCSQRLIADYFGVSSSDISHIASGFRWGWVQPAPEEEALTQVAILHERRQAERAARPFSKALQRAEPVLRDCHAKGHGLKRMAAALEEAGILSANGRRIGQSTIDLWRKRLGLR